MTAITITAATVAPANITTLRKMASQLKIKGYSLMKKEQLKAEIMTALKKEATYDPQAEEAKVTKKVTKKVIKPSAHAHCTHPATKAARAACRRSRKAEEIAGAQLAAAGK